MIIGCDLIVQLCLTNNFKLQILQWDGAKEPMKKPRGLIGKPDLNKRKMRKVIMQTVEPASTIEATDILVKIIDSIYVNENFTQIADNVTHMDSEDRTQLLELLKYFEDLCDITLGDFYTDPVELDLNSASKPFNGKNYPVNIINKGNFRKELERLVEIEVLTTSTT